MTVHPWTHSSFVQRVRKSLPGISMAVVVTLAAAVSLFIASSTPEANIAAVPEAPVADAPEATIVKVSDEPKEKSISAAPSEKSNAHN